MSSTYTTRLRLEKQTTAENDSTWGDKLDTVLDLIDDAISGLTSIATTGGTTTLSANNSAADQSRMAIIKVTGVLASNAILVIPAQTKQYTVWNATTGSFSVTVKTSGGAGIAITQGKKSSIFCDATDCFRQDDDVAAASSFASGTRMVFQQTLAPSGWTKDSTAALNDSVMRIVTGTASSGGADAFSTLFGTSKVTAAAAGNTAGYTLTSADIPAHTHPQIVSDGNGSFTSPETASSNAAGITTAQVTGSTGGGGSHAHGLNAHTHTLSNMNLKYYDFIVAVAN